MWDSIQQYFQASPVSTDVVYSLFILSLISVLRLIVIFAVFKRNPTMPLDMKRRWMVVSRNLTFMSGLLALFLIWAAQIQTLAISMVAVAAATVLATKELIMCLSGSILRGSTRLYSVGDYIEVGNIKGRVIDINMLNTVMMELGTNNHLSGQTVSFPNSLLLTQHLVKDAVFGQYVVHYFEIPITVTINPEGVLNFVQDKTLQHSAPYLQKADRYFQALKSEKLYLIPSVEPLVKIKPFNDKLHVLAVRLVVPIQERQRIEQDITRATLLYQYHQDRH